jgi:cell division protein FtsA
LQELADANLMIDIPTVGDRPGRHVSKRALAEVVEARYEELFTLVAAEIRRSGLEDSIAAGVVLTGGASKVEGAIELAERIFKVPVRLGLPQFVTGLPDIINNPIYATGVGLLIYGLQQRETQQEALTQPNLKGLWGRMRSWFQGNF